MKQKHKDIDCNATSFMWQIVNERKEKEANPTKHVLYSKLTVVNLKRGAAGNLLSYNDAYLYHEYGERDNQLGMWHYSSLSRIIHKYSYHSKRGKIEQELDKLIPNDEYSFERVREILKIGVVRYFNKRKLPLPKQRVQNRIKNLCNQFIAESPKYHYKLTRQQKSMLKRLSKKGLKYWRENAENRDIYYSIYVY
ncbi:hypothetical protein BCR26_08840 [Enterococcus rivorum]|uniref:Uncharacterized protein n=1 Tax=Enterococcus rivorum TaxID=762845 RepID=A0A1E5L0G3_9ENTE|nr:hypothetical protein BCR26_08840 [Enterococcus rivorum]